MKTLEAFYNGEQVYIHHLSKLLEVALVSYSKDPVKMFKVDIRELTGLTEEELYRILRDQEVEEQLKRKGY